MSSGQPPNDAPDDPLVGQLLDGRYRIDVKIGEGGMGKVYRGTRELLGKLVAVKTLELEVEAAEREELIERFTREAQATAAIRHENVVEIIDFGQTTDCIYFVMELLEGYSLGELIGQGRRIEPLRLIPLAIQIAHGLHAAHVLGIIHRDVKPSNIFICPTREGEERAKVLDFGLAKVSDGLKLDRVGMTFGTASYMSPEQARDANLDARTDIYSLGCLMFEALTGRPPFVGDTFMEVVGQHLEQAPPRIAELQPGIELPPGLEDVITSALAKDPNERFSTMQAVASALSSIEAPPSPREPSLLDFPLDEPEDSTALTPSAFDADPSPPPPLLIEDEDEDEPEPASQASEFGFSAEMVHEHLEQCRVALAEILAGDRSLAELAEEPLVRWRTSASVLGLESAGGVREALVTAFEDRECEVDERTTAALLLLDVASKEGPELLLDHAADAEVAEDDDGVEAVVTALELGAGTHRDKLLVRGYNQASPGQRARWIGAIERQGFDPGSEILASALASNDPDALAAGLRLLCVHAARTDHQHTLLPHMFAVEPAVRSAALAAGLVLGLPQAPILVGQTARHPGMSACAYLHAIAASPKQLHDLVEIVPAPPGLDFALALSGRPRALAAVIARAPSAETLAGIRFATGFEGSAEDLPTWWMEHAARFADDNRIILGLPASPAQFLTGLRQASAEIWAMLRLELLVRSKGALALPTRRLPDALLATVDAIDTSQLTWLASG